MASLSSDRDHYFKTLRVFSTAYKQEEVYDTWMEEIFPGEVEAKIGTTRGDVDELRVLGVGSGSGEMDCAMLGKLVSRFPCIRNRVVEPNKEQLARFEKLATSKAHELRGVSFDWRQQTIEEYENARDSTKFHFITAIHSMYYMKDLRHSLMYLYDLLEPEGVLLVIMLSDNSGLWRFGDHFKSDNSGDYAVSSANIRSILDRQAIPYCLHHQRRQIDITDCFTEGSEAGGLLLDFLLQVVKFRETTSADLQARVMEYLGRSDCSEKKADNKTYLGGGHDAIVIKKPVPSSTSSSG